jgi:flagellar biosynthesis protein FlhF
MLSTEKGLRAKSFFASSVQEAIEQAQHELGPDAFLLNSREAPPEARHLGALEVVFGAQLDALSTVSPAPQATSSADNLRQSVDEIRQMLGRISASTRGIRARYGPVEQTLIEMGVNEELACDIDESVQRRLGKRLVPRISRSQGQVECDPETILYELSEEILSRFEVAPEVGQVTALVGPPGSGKTSALVKLAVAQGLALGKPVRLISADSQRVGAAEQLKAYAAILGASFYAAESAVALGQAIDNSPSNALVLIDTPGYSRVLLRDLGEDLAAFFSRRQNIDVHLVLTASMRSSDLASAADHFSIFRPAKLLFTRLDETSSFASVFCEAVRQQRPLSFLCEGQSIPEDLAPASKGKIASSLVSQLPHAIRAVA